MTSWQRKCESTLTEAMEAMERLLSSQDDNESWLMYTQRKIGRGLQKRRLGLQTVCTSREEGSKGMKGELGMISRAEVAASRKTIR